MKMHYSKLVSGLLISSTLIGCGGGSSGGSGGTTKQALKAPYQNIETLDYYEQFNDNNLDKPETLPSLIDGEKNYHTIYPIGDVDHIKVELNDPVKYEFYANDVCATCNVQLDLFDPNNIKVASDDSYFGADARIVYTINSPGTYTMQIKAKQHGKGVARYTAGFHTHINKDGDDFSRFYDCDDANNQIHPLASEILADGIEQSCLGYDVIDSQIADSFEDDDSIKTAIDMVEASGSLDEFIYRTELKPNMRSLHDSADVDYFRLELEPYESVFLSVNKFVGDDVGFEVISGEVMLVNNPVKSKTLYNLTKSRKVYYLKFQAMEPNAFTEASYIPAYISYGTDKDQDDYYSKDWANSRDCDDSDANTHPNATEIHNDGIDQDCNGEDSILELVM